MTGKRTSLRVLLRAAVSCVSRPDARLCEFCGCELDVTVVAHSPRCPKATT